jgi:hypothetical protein
MHLLQLWFFSDDKAVAPKVRVWLCGATLLLGSRETVLVRCFLIFSSLLPSSWVPERQCCCIIHIYIYIYTLSSTPPTFLLGSRETMLVRQSNA